ncbi:MAG TPA: surface-adhesin E family protein [Phenylobacterium sp.]|nr:surface-adhesin E family protein [Phenylobacterium sp.]
MRIAALLGVVAFALGGPAASETWQVFSRSVNNAFMTDPDSITTEGEITSIKVATVPREGESGDLSHSIETYQFRCDADQWRTAGVIEYGPDGVEAGQYPEEDAAWEALRRDTLPNYLKEIACEGARAVPPHWPTIQAFIEAGRA